MAVNRGVALRWALMVSLALGGLGAVVAAPGVAVAQSQQQVPITIGQSVQGQLAAGDRQLSSGEWVDNYLLTVRGGERVRIAMQSTEFDTYILVRGPGVSEDNDDAPGQGTNSEVTLTFPQAGQYTIGATSYAPGETGRYALQVLPAGAAAPQPVQPQAQQVQQVQQGAASAPGRQAIRAGQQVTGSLAAGDGQIQSGEYADIYEFDGAAGQQVRITMQSSQFDTYLMLRGQGVVQDNDDAPGQGTNSELVYTLPAAGRYAIYATSYQPGETGQYTLRFEVVGGASAQSATTAPQTLRIGQTVQGALQDGDFQRQNGQLFDRYIFEGRAGQRVTIAMSSTEFDTYLFVRAPDGSGDENDDIDLAANNLNSRIDYTLPVNGRYEIHASAFAASARGRYELSLIDASAIPAPAAAAAPAQQIAAGRRERGTLAAGDTTLQSGEYYDVYTLQARRGQTFTISAISSDFDTWLELRGPGDFSDSNDDGIPGTTNARLSFSAPADGQYSVIVTSYRPGETGAYELIIEEGAGGTAGGGTPAAGQAGAGQGRVVAVLAGISDYGGRGDLPYCAQDAVNIRDALARTGMLAPESTLLVDGQVTRANMRSAFQRAARATGPDDTFLFFFSGHGSRQPSQDPRELDGMDETLYVRDGHITDDEIAGWFDEIGGRVEIIALDACFAGGFARDVVSSANRVGIFSSEEDVTSNVASRFQAGGYLSHFLREALSPASDVDPADGMITVGELTQHIRRQWAQHMQSERVVTDFDERAYQNLVIDRQAKVTDVVLYRTAPRR